MKQLLAAFVIFSLVGSAQSAWADDADPVTCKVYFPSFAENDTHWVGALSAYANAKGLERSLGDAYVDLKDRRLQNELQAIGKLGYLVEFHVIKSKAAEITDRRLQFVELHGVGATPEDALVSSFSRDRMSPSPPEGFEDSPDDSYFMWLRRSGKSVSSQCISPPGSSLLKSNAMIRVRSAKLLESSENLKKSVVFHELSLAAQARASSKAVRARLAAVEENRQKAAETLNKINSDLAKAIEEQRRGEGLQRTLSMLQGVLTVIQMIDLASATLNDPSANFSEAKTPSDVVSITKEYTIRAGENVQNIKQSLTFRNKQLSDAINTWIESHKNEGVPPTIIPILR